jgi:anti-sigma-K factor RskA
MPVWEWILIAACVAIAVAAVLVAASLVSRRKRTQRLKQHCGREYERLVSQTGDEKAAEKELTARERKRDKLDIVSLTPSALSDFTTRWHEV